MKSQIKSKVKAKTGGIKARVKGKVLRTVKIVKRPKREVAAKVKNRLSGNDLKAVSHAERKYGRLCAMLVAAGLLGGCTATPSRSQTLTMRDCTINVYGAGVETNELARVEICTQGMAIETSGTETQTASPANTVSPSADLNMSKAATGGGTLGAVIDSVVSGLTSVGNSAATSASATTDCADGSCSDTACTDGSCTP